MRSCGGCEQKGFKASFDIRPAEGGKEGGASSWLEGASYAQQAECMDLSSNCKGWAAEGMCEDNRSYMVRGPLLPAMEAFLMADVKPCIQPGQVGTCLQIRGKQAGSSCMRIPR